MGCMGVQIIYLEPIRTSLWLNENVERMLQSCANAGRLLKGQIPAHFSAGMAAEVSKQDGHVGRQQ